MEGDSYFYQMPKASKKTAEMLSAKYASSSSPVFLFQAVLP